MLKHSSSVLSFMDDGPFKEFRKESISKTISVTDDMDILEKHQIAFKFFDENLANEYGVCNGHDIAVFLIKNGFLKDDPRFKTIFLDLMKDEHHYRTDITIGNYINLENLNPKLFFFFILDDFIQILGKSGHSFLLERIFLGKLTIPDFQNFCEKVKEIYESVKSAISESEGETAAYIPQLSKVNKDLFGISICTLDGQRFDLGDAHENFCIQSCIKPLIYGLALEEHGEEIVHNHVGREPSGVAFNSLSMNKKNLPHNPMINAGAIMSCSLIKNSDPLHERFDYLMNKLKELSGNISWGFNNSVYLSEKITADSNFCLAYLMRKNQVFPKNTRLEETLDFYFQCCSIETNCNKQSIAAATIANGGVCPLTGRQIFNSLTCRSILSLMSSCGMYDYSGEWTFKIGIPAKSGVSGVIFSCIPGLGSITVYAPPLDEIGNSVRGIEFFKQFVNAFTVHNFDNVHTDVAISRVNPLANNKMDERYNKINALYAAAEGDITTLRLLLLKGVPATASDYDQRTLLHLAASEGHYAIVKYLLKYHDVDVNATDRWGGTALSDAKKKNHLNTVNLLTIESEKKKNLN
ncbi:hypothetical protein HDU92_007519 [Lobulomyces angularis]|nr:hypothetical protein HDU92_007519 [Lobulomyces angularis]